MERLTKREQLACHNVAYVSDDDCFDVWSVPKKFMGNAIDRLAAYEDTNLEPNEIRQFKTEIETIKEAVDALFEKQEFLKFLESKGYDITLGTKWMCKVFDILHDDKNNALISIDRLRELVQAELLPSRFGI